LAAGYQPATWESGVPSGLGYAWRRWVSDTQGFTLTELTGRLHGSDIEGIAAAALYAAATILGQTFPPGAHAAWRAQVIPPACNGPGADNRQTPSFESSVKPR
jgi:hypothetical protein